MFVNNLVLENYRNYAAAQVEFSEGINVVIGDNGQGKTNILESIHFLTAARSFRTSHDRELISFGKPFAKIKAGIYSQQRQQTMEIILPRSGKKQIYVNAVKQQKLSDIAGKVMTVLFCPEDLFLVKSGPSIRRRLMDTAICQLRPKYAIYLARFNRALEQKTTILKEHRQNPALLDVLDDFSAALAQNSAHLIFYRASFVRMLNIHASKIYGELSGGREELALTYKTVSTVQNPLSSPLEIYQDITLRQQSLRQAEIDSAQCLTGAHRDDIIIDIKGVSARSYGSQGQNRSAALSVKLAERDIFFEESGQTPILLLDDVLSELDANRQDFVLNRIQSGQVLITCCEDRRIAKRTGAKILHVSQGVIS